MDATERKRTVATVRDVFPLGRRGLVLVMADQDGPIPAGGLLWNGSAFVSYAGPEFLDTVGGDAYPCVTVAEGDIGLVAALTSVEFTSTPAAGSSPA